MQRRDFIRSGLAMSVLGGLGTRLHGAVGTPGELKADVVVLGGGTGGVAAALAAARTGRSVILTEETDWIGGQLTAQAVPPDEHPWIESFGCTRSYRQFREGVRRHYREHFPLTAEARANPRLNPGNGSVSRLCHEPRVALAVLEQMLAPYVASGRIRVLLRTQVVGVDLKGDRLAAVGVESALLGRVTLTGAYFIDATELGDLLPLAKVEHVVGSESRKETGEPSAPEEADPMDQQAVTWCFAMDHLEGEDHVIPKPARWDFWSQYVPDLKPAWPGPLFSWDYSDPVSLKSRRLPFDPMLRVTGLNLWTYRRIVDQAQFVPGTYRGGTTLVNWPQNDYWLAPLIGPGVTPEQKEERLLDARQVSLCLLYWMQTQAPRPDGGTGWKGLRLRPDVTDGPAGLAKSVYIRESRRILAEFTVTENHVGTDARMKQTGKAKEEVTAEVFPDSVGVGAYRIDLHPSTSGRNYVDISSVPFQIPLGALIPRRVENLLAGCKNLGVTHLTNGCYRLHPVEWNIGEAAGAVASFCLDRKESPRAVRATPKLLADFQQRLRNQGFELEWPRTRPL
jgi:hypothetical protein